MAEGTLFLGIPFTTGAKDIEGVHYSADQWARILEAFGRENGLARICDVIHEALIINGDPDAPLPQGVIRA